MDLRPARCQKQQRPGPGRWNRLNLLTVSCVYQRRPGIFIKKKNANYELKKNKKKNQHIYASLTLLPIKNVAPEFSSVIDASLK